MRRFLVDLSQITADQAAGNTPLLGGSGCITYYSVQETTGSAAASYNLYDEGPASGQMLQTVALSDGQSTRENIILHSLSFVGGLFYVLESGAIAGSFVGYTDHVCEDVLSAHAAILQIEGAAALKALGEL